MAPLIEHASQSDHHVLPINEETKVTLVSGETVSAVSTTTGGFLRREYPQPDTILEPGEFVELSNGSLLVSSSLEDNTVEPNPMNDGGVV